MTDHVEIQAQHLPPPAETITAVDEDPSLRQLHIADEFLLAVRNYAHKKASQPLIDEARRSLDGHTAAETILSVEPPEEKVAKVLREISGEIFNHEINNILQMTRNCTCLSLDEAVPEAMWGDTGSEERQAFEAVLQRSWDESESRLRNLRTVMSYPYGMKPEDISLDDLLSEDFKSAYIGMYFGKEGLYPHHLTDMNTLRTIFKGLVNVKDLFSGEASDRQQVIKEIGESKVTVTDFFSIFLDRDIFILHGNTHREINQFEINLLFEMVHNARKYNVTKTEPIEIYVDDSGNIEVKNRSRKQVDSAFAELGKRGDEASEQKGHGFGIFKMKTLANMNNQVLEYANEPLGDDGSTFAVTCSLRKAA